MPTYNTVSISKLSDTFRSKQDQKVIDKMQNGIVQSLTYS